MTQNVPWLLKRLVSTSNTKFHSNSFSHFVVTNYTFCNEHVIIKCSPMFQPPINARPVFSHSRLSHSIEINVTDLSLWFVASHPLPPPLPPGVVAGKIETSLGT